MKPPARLEQATSSLDTLTERRIQDALHGLKADRTTFIVAHRLSTIMDADLIVVMNVRYLPLCCTSPSDKKVQYIYRPMAYLAVERLSSHSE